MKDTRVLFVGDPNLGEAGLEIVRSVFPDTTPVIWTKGQPRAPAREVIRSAEWDLGILFYAELILQPADLERVRLGTINLHPAAPSCPGVGYDTLPLLDGHRTHGATAHFVDERIDHGDIFDVMERELPDRCDYAELRRRNQRLTLEQLERTTQRFARDGDIAATLASMRADAASLGARWGSYVDGPTLNERLERLRLIDEQHPVFVGNKVFSGALSATRV